MIPLIIALLLFVLSFLLFRQYQKVKAKVGRYTSDGEGWLFLSVLAGCAGAAALIALIIVAAQTNTSHVDDRNKVIELEAKYDEILQYRERVESNIRTSLQQYPEFEEEIVKDINPQILLAYPQLRSSETLTAQFDALDKADERLLNTKTQQLRTERQMRTREENPMLWGLLWVS